VTELSDLEKQGINAYYGHFVPLRRSSAIEDLRPEEALPPKAVTAQSRNRRAHGSAR
jgi:hypothetical protein